MFPRARRIWHPVRYAFLCSLGSIPERSNSTGGLIDAGLMRRDLDLATQDLCDLVWTY